MKSGITPSLGPIILDILLKQAITNIPTLNPGQEFELKNLFQPEQWEAICVEDRRELGTMFSEYVENNGVVFVERQTNRHNKYKKSTRNS